MFPSSLMAHPAMQAAMQAAFDPDATVDKMAGFLTRVFGLACIVIAIMMWNVIKGGRVGEAAGSLAALMLVGVIAAGGVVSLAAGPQIAAWFGFGT